MEKNIITLLVFPLLGVMGSVAWLFWKICPVWHPENVIKTKTQHPKPKPSFREELYFDPKSECYYIRRTYNEKKENT